MNLIIKMIVTMVGALGLVSILSCAGVLVGGGSFGEAFMFYLKLAVIIVGFAVFGAVIVACWL